MCYFTPGIYKEENLKAEDKKTLDIWRNAFNEILNDRIINDFLVDKNIDNLERELLKERLRPFWEHMKNKADFLIQDLIISLIEKYDDSEIEKLTSQNISE